MAKKTRRNRRTAGIMLNHTAQRTQERGTYVDPETLRLMAESVRSNTPQKYQLVCVDRPTRTTTRWKTDRHPGLVFVYSQNQHTFVTALCEYMVGLYTPFSYKELL
jgi:hypothetical protein